MSVTSAVTTAPAAPAAGAAPARAGLVLVALIAVAGVANLDLATGAKLIARTTDPMWFMFPRHDRERELLTQYRAEDAVGAAAASTAIAAGVPA